MTSRMPQGWWKRALAALLSGIVGSMALPPVGFFPGLLALSAPLFWMALSRHRLEGFVLGYATGFGWFVVSMVWISQAFVTAGGGNVFLIPFAALGLPLLLGLFWAVAFMIAAAFIQNPVARLLLAVITLALAEYARGIVLTGFPWNAPGMVFANADITLGAAAWLGLWGLCLMALAFAVIPALLILKARLITGGLITMLLAVMMAGYLHAGTGAVTTVASVMTVRLVQPNIPQRDKWNRDLRQGHFSQLITLSRQSYSHESVSPSQGISSGHPDLIVWPETAFAGVFERERGVLSSVTQAASSGVTPLITGMLRVEPGPLIYNSMGLIGPDGRMLDTYDKTHLVPFGEYAPLRHYLPFVDAIAGPYDFQPGAKRDVFTLSLRHGQQVRILPLICYEVIFPQAVRHAVTETGADMIVTVTNDAWFGDTIGPRQHLAIARMRSAELGLPIIRVANTGISAVIDSHGRITHRIPYDETGVIDAPVSGSIKTPYARHGDRLFWLLLISGIVMVCLIEGLTRQKQAH